MRQNPDSGFINLFDDLQARIEILNVRIRKAESIRHSTRLPELNKAMILKLKREKLELLVLL
jgi:hypothetical protein